MNKKWKWEGQCYTHDTEPQILKNMKLFDHKNSLRSFVNCVLRDFTPKANKKAASKISTGPFKQFNLLSRISQRFKASAPHITREPYVLRAP